MDTKKIQEIITIFENSKITSMDLEVGDIKIKLEKNTVITTSPQVMVNTPVVKESVEEKDYVKSPLVGTYYEAPSQDSEPFIKIGDYVNEGDTLCIIEAMKVMNEIKAPKSGYIGEILMKNGQTVEFGEDLIYIGEKHD